MAYQYLNPNAGNEFSQNANQWMNSMSQDNARVFQAKSQIAAQQNALIMQAISTIMSVGGGFMKGAQQNGVNNSVMNSLQNTTNAPRAGLVAGPGGQSAQDFSAANPNVQTTGTAPFAGFTGNRGTLAMEELQKRIQLQKLMGQPTTPEETLRQQAATAALQNPNLLTPQQSSERAIQSQNKSLEYGLRAGEIANKATSPEEILRQSAARQALQDPNLLTPQQNYQSGQRELAQSLRQAVSAGDAANRIATENARRGTTGAAAASQAVLPYNMSTLGDPNTLANAPASQLGQPSQDPAVSVNINKNGNPTVTKNLAETQARTGVDQAIKAITKQAGLATPMGLDGFVATSGAAVDNGNGTIKYMGVDITNETWDQILGLVSSVAKPSQPMSVTGGSAPAQSGATFNRYFGQ